MRRISFSVFELFTCIILHHSLIYNSATLIRLIFVVLFIFWRKRKSRGNIILLTGLSDSGKTLIYARLLYSQFVKTYTSVKENIGDITINYVRFKQHFVIY